MYGTRNLTYIRTFMVAKQYVTVRTFMAAGRTFVTHVLAAGRTFVTYRRTFTTRYNYETFRLPYVYEYTYVRVRVGPA